MNRILIYPGSFLHLQCISRHIPMIQVRSVGRRSAHLHGCRPLVYAFAPRRPVRRAAGANLINLFLDMYWVLLSATFVREPLGSFVPCNICTRPFPHTTNVDYLASSPANERTCSEKVRNRMVRLVKQYIGYSFSRSSTSLYTTLGPRLYAKTVWSSFLKGSRVNSSAEHGYVISNFSRTEGCRIPRTPISRSSGELSAAFSVRFNAERPEYSLGGR